MKDAQIDRGREEGLRKYALLAPLLEEGVPAFEMARRRSLLREQQGISERTLRRWLAAYRKGGFDALVQSPRRDKGSCKAIVPEVLALARDAGLSTIAEAFADRGYRRDGTLVPRGEAGALLTDSAEIARRVVELVTTGTLTAVDGSRIDIDAKSICLHGDTPGAVGHAQATRAALLGAGINLAPVIRR